MQAFMEVFEMKRERLVLLPAIVLVGLFVGAMSARAADIDANGNAIGWEILRRFAAIRPRLGGSFQSDAPFTRSITTRNQASRPGWRSNTKGR